MEKRNHRKVVIQLLGGKCKNCGRINDLEDDHIIPLSMGGTDDAVNHQVLCGPCHKEKTRLDLEKLAFYRIFMQKASNREQVLQSIDFVVKTNEDLRKAGLDSNVTTPAMASKYMHGWLKRSANSRRREMI